MIMLTREKGFTLIELLVVVAIIGVLASMVMSSLNDARQKSREARWQSEMRAVQTALELYYLDHGSYPISEDWDSAAVHWGGQDLSGPNAYIGNAGPGTADFSPTYMATLPYAEGSRSDDGFLYWTPTTGEGYKLLLYDPGRTILDMSQPLDVNHPFRDPVAWRSHSWALCEGDVACAH